MPGSAGLPRQRTLRTVLLPYRPDAWLVVTLAAAGLAALAYAVLAMRVHQALQTTAFDLAFFDQIIWNTAHGRWFQTTYISYNFLGQHLELVLLPIAALYRLGAGPQQLLMLQAVAAALAAVPLFCAGRRLVGAPAGCLLAVAYLVSATLQRGLDFGFHPDLFEPLLVFWALAALLSQRRIWFLVLVGGLLLVKEDAFLLALPLAWICWHRGERRLGIAVAAGAFTLGVLALGVLMPLLRGSQSGDLIERYGYLAGSGGGALDLMRGAALHPDRVAGHLLSPAPLAAVIGLLLSLGLVPLLAPEVVLAGAPAMLVALLSNHGPQRSLDLQYGVPALVVVMLALPYGLQRAARWYTQRRRVPTSVTTRGWPITGIAGVVLAFSLGGAWLRGPYPLEGHYRASRFEQTADSAALKRVARLIPASASLSAQTGLAPHLAHRQVQWEWPRLEDAAYVITQDEGIFSKQSLGTYTGDSISPVALGYSEIAHDAGIHLYRRDGVEKWGQP